MESDTIINHLYISAYTALFMPEGNLTLDVLKSVQAEETGKFSLSNLKINVGHGTVYASIACYAGE